MTKTYKIWFDDRRVIPAGAHVTDCSSPTVQWDKGTTTLGVALTQVEYLAPQVDYTNIEHVGFTDRLQDLPDGGTDAERWPTGDGVTSTWASRMLSHVAQGTRFCQLDQENLRLLHVFGRDENNVVGGATPEQQQTAELEMIAQLEACNCYLPGTAFGFYNHGPDAKQYLPGGFEPSRTEFIVNQELLTPGVGCYFPSLYPLENATNQHYYFDELMEIVMEAQDTFNRPAICLVSQRFLSAPDASTYYIDDAVFLDIVSRIFAFRPCMIALWHAEPYYLAQINPGWSQAQIEAQTVENLNRTFNLMKQVVL